ncbi:MAG: histidine kinase [Gammaproteobacteria bacterium]|uniref:helix-turn-helix domain-containing protein n=1 Tax=Rhodoferax sp. TaxID=50421 RepID=UPI001826326A|nr:helix-turn-helix domain-containing protein [Rhodoferax sp.]MBU3899843.1 histidine kinase [Gammaproteobacteria bacterium]MBA3057955.1 histidine kinase [Rhodoferax sp.]MBU3996026.1 histidine kinase [Gammaproteobacteria bacterium]MBU4019108.1 histidine kinase [Gammaproteobacteria bacterium]MBU4078826.1 histidine kinase [Gammaproteobacteria bacterium]
MNATSLSAAISSTNTRPALRLAGIAQARRTVLLDSGAALAGSLAPEVERSWQRCLSWGLRPLDPISFAEVSTQQMRRTLDANQRLVQSAKPVLEKLGRAILNTRYFAVLTNSAGVVVDVSGPIDRSDPRAHLITRIGADLSERSIGTTAIGTALSELAPVWLHRGEHFFDATSAYSCAGAPLFGPDGACVGMLDVTGIDAVERPELKHLVTQFASKIESALLLSQAHRLLLRLNWPGTALGNDGDGMVCLDRDGWVTGANSAARQMVPSLSVAGPLGVPARLHVSEVFGIAFEMLFDAARRPNTTLDIPLWTGLTLQVLPIERAHETMPVAANPGTRRAENLSLRDIEDALIYKTVSDARGNVAEAARLLGISRATVYRKIGKRH